MPKQTDHKKNMVLFNLKEHQNMRSALQDQTEEKSEIIELASVEKDGFTISWGLKTQEEKIQDVAGYYMSLHGLSTVQYHYGILQNLKTLYFIF